MSLYLFFFDCFGKEAGVDNNDGVFASHQSDRARYVSRTVIFVDARYEYLIVDRLDLTLVKQVHLVAGKCLGPDETLKSSKQGAKHCDFLHDLLLGT